MKTYKLTLGDADPTNGQFGHGGWRFVIERRKKYASIARTDAYGNIDSKIDNVPIAEFDAACVKYTPEGVHDCFFNIANYCIY